MYTRKVDNPEREQRILDSAAQLLIQYGYDKTNMEDVAQAAGVSRGILYLHFAGKDELYEALLQRAVRQYARDWLEAFNADPQGGTIGSMLRAVLRALSRQPLMAALVKRDGRVFGSYLRKPNNLFAQGPTLRTEFLEAMQAAGAIRAEVKPAVIARLMDSLTFGILGADGEGREAGVPSFDELMEAAATMLDRMLTPDGGGNREAGREVIRRMAAAAEAAYEAAAAQNRHRPGTKPRGRPRKPAPEGRKRQHKTTARPR